MEEGHSQGLFKPGARPVFLTLLCILSFLGSTWGITKAVMNYFAADHITSTAMEVLASAQDELKNDGPVFIQNIFNENGELVSPNTLRQVSAFRLLACLLTLTGALLMFSLMRKGFYFYVAGIITGILSPAILIGNTMFGTVHSFSVALSGILFIVLYLVNLKYMIYTGHTKGKAYNY